MPSLRVGHTDIPYEIRRSATVSTRRITVTPGRVEVLALTADDDAAVDDFLERKRQWIFNTVREMEQITANRHAVPRFITGSKIPYRGRRASLIVRHTDGERVEISYRNGFIVDLPAWVGGKDADHLVAQELKLWLKQKARRDVVDTAGDYRKRFGLTPQSIRVADFPNGWGSCGPRGNILINWHLIFAPKKVLQYVVAHELAHLRYRSHAPEFWTYLASILPDYLATKDWLENHQKGLDAGFLG